MNLYFVDEFNNFFNSLNNFEKNLIMWCSISNSECPYEFFKLILDQTEDQNKKAIETNYIGRITNKNLIDFTPNEEQHLKYKMKELDGTLLVDIVWECLKSHKIFK